MKQSEDMMTVFHQNKIGLHNKDWGVTNLGDLSDKIMVGIASSATHAYRDTGIVLLRNQNIKENLIDDSELLFIDPIYELTHKNKRLKEGDVITVRTGYPGISAVVPKKYEGAQCFTSLITRPKKDKINSHWLAYYINSPIGKKLISGAEAGGAQKNVNASVLSKLSVPIVPIDEQKKIASILSSWGEAIEQTQKLIDQLKLRKKGLMQQLLTGNKRLPGFDGEWKKERLEKYFDERRETDHDELPLLSVGKDGVYPQDSDSKKDTSNADKSKYKRICAGDIGYNTMRMWQGRSALSQLEGIVSPAYTIVKPKENADSLFFSYLFKLEEMVHKFYRNSQCMVSDTWMCKFKDFKIVRFQAPSSLKEQISIAKILKAADDEIEATQQLNQELEIQKKGLMQQLLTGKKRVKVD